MNNYQKTEWVFDHGDCKGCSHLQHEAATQLDPECYSCSVLDNWSRHSDRCPRLDQYNAAFLKVLCELAPSEVIEDHWERLTELCTHIVEGTISEDDMKAGEMIRCLYRDVAEEEAERRML